LKLSKCHFESTTQILGAGKKLKKLHDILKAKINNLYDPGEKSFSSLLKAEIWKKKLKM
jgi:hypothetical protein